MLNLPKAFFLLFITVNNFSCDVHCIPTATMACVPSASAQLLQLAVGHANHSCY